MTTALTAISSYRDTKSIDTPPTTIMSNDILNAFLHGLLDRDDGLGEEEGYIDDDGTVDDDKRDAYMAFQEEEEEKPSLIMNEHGRNREFGTKRSGRARP